MAKNANADNDYWEEYKLQVKGFRGDPDELEDLVIENDLPRALKKRHSEPTKLPPEDNGN